MIISTPHLFVSVFLTTPLVVEPLTELQEKVDHVVFSDKHRFILPGAQYPNSFLSASITHSLTDSLPLSVSHIHTHTHTQTHTHAYQQNKRVKRNSQSVINHLSQIVWLRPDYAHTHARVMGTLVLMQVLELFCIRIYVYMYTGCDL